MVHLTTPFRHQFNKLTAYLQPAIQANPALALKAVYSRSLASAKSLSSDLDSFDLYSDDNEGAGYDELLRRDDIKGVVIA